MKLYSFVPTPFKKYISESFFRYGIMAVVVVGIEITSFWFINSVLGIHYLIATVLSLAIGIVLNWLGSRYYVFGASHHSAKKEFALVGITSLFGVILQTSIVFISVDTLDQAPLLGKIVAIIITFFWNYIVRKKYIYYKNHAEN